MFDLISVVDFWNDLLLVNAVQQHVLHKLWQEQQKTVRGIERLGRSQAGMKWGSPPCQTHAA